MDGTILRLGPPSSPSMLHQETLILPNALMTLSNARNIDPQFNTKKSPI